MPSSQESSSCRGESTCRSILCRTNPAVIDAWKGSSYGNTTSTKGAFDRVIFNKEANCTIQEWTDFTYEAIDLAYGDLLDQVPINVRRAHTPTTTPTTVEDENGIDDLGKAWTCNIVRAPLKHAGKELRSRPTVCSQKPKLPTDPVLGPRMKWTHPDLDPTELKPDWAAYDREVEKLYYSAAEKDPKKPLAFAIGDSKMCQKWKSAWIHRSLAAGYVDTNPAKKASGKEIQKTHDVTKERLRPLEQLATYCRFGETRYGFILTQTELVAFRVRRLNPALISAGPRPVVASPHAGMEYKSVPWDESGPGKLTAHLAIWALACMGMNEHHRIMETSSRDPLDSMVRLTKWTHDEKMKVYRNDISGREITEDSWEKLGTAVGFVKLDGQQGGSSSTSTFTSGGGIASITQGMGAASLNTTASRGRKPADAAQQSKPANQGAAASKKPNPADQGAASSIKSTSGTNSPPKKYAITGKKDSPAYEMGMSNGKKVLKMDKKEVLVEVDSKKQQYYYVPPGTKDKVYLVPV